MIKYPELHDIEWLEERYIKNNLSTSKISKILGCRPFAVTCALRKFGFHTRDMREAQVFLREDYVIDNADFIEGGLLGDATMPIFNKNSKICCPRYRKKNKNKDHVEWFANHVTSSPNVIEITEFKRFPNPKYNKVLTFFQFNTNSSPVLLPYYRRWYPESNKFKKIVPPDLKLNSTKVLNWFLDDGFSTYRDRTKEGCQYTSQVLLVLCSQSFTLEENNFLVDLLKKEGIIFDKAGRVICKQLHYNPTYRPDSVP